MVNRRRQGARIQRDRQQGGVDESYLEAVGEVGTHEEDRSGETSEAKKKTFRALGSAWIQVSVDEMGQEATLEGLFLGDDGDLTVRDILVALQEHYGVQYGIDRAQLQQHFE